MSEVKVIGIGNDHAAVDLKNEIKAYLEEKGYKVVNYGTDSSESCDYPVYGALSSLCKSSCECSQRRRSKTGNLNLWNRNRYLHRSQQSKWSSCSSCKWAGICKTHKRTQQCKHHCIRCKNRWKRNGKSNRRCMAWCRIYRKRPSWETSKYDWGRSSKV